MKGENEMRMGMKALLTAVAVCLVAGGITTVFGQAFPTRPIHVIVPLTAGSGADVVGRIVAKHMSTGLGQPVVVENRPGAGGQIGTLAVVKSAPDGYTLVVQSASHAANPAIYKTLPYDSLKDLVDIAILGMTPSVRVSSATGPYRSLKALVDAAKAKPGEIPFASAGVGTVTHLTAEYFAQMAGIKMLHIPYKGSPEAIRDAAAGRVSFYMAPINTAIGLIKDGKIAALGVSTSRRVAVLPEVPTIAEQGVSGFSMTLWFGMWAPAGTPQTVVRKLNADVNRIMQLQELREQYATLGVDPVTMQPEEFAKFVREEIATNQRIVKQANIQQQ
jgi:tripartite-type tricarboxylate transporter receptor subunit TctC